MEAWVCMSAGELGALDWPELDGASTSSLRALHGASTSTLELLLNHGRHQLPASFDASSKPPPQKDTYPAPRTGGINDRLSPTTSTTPSTDNGDSPKAGDYLDPLGPHQIDPERAQEDGGEMPASHDD